MLNLKHAPGAPLCDRRPCAPVAPAATRGSHAALALSLALSAALVPACVPFTLSNIFLRPTDQIVATPADLGLTYDSVRLQIAPGREVAVWAIRRPGARGAVVVVPGSDRNKSIYLPAAEVFGPGGLDVILMDYEGFGESSGTIFDLSLAELLDDALVVVQFARSQYDTLIVYGISGGAPPAAHAAATVGVEGLILEAPLVLDRWVEFWLIDQGVASPLLVDIANAWVHPQIPANYDTLSDVAAIEAPKLILHSPEDELVSFMSGGLVYEAAVEPKTFVPIRGDHGEMVEIAFEEYRSIILTWIEDAVFGHDET